jgi:hypothetical protein
MSNNDYLDNEAKTPTKGSELTNNHEYSEDQLSRGIDTAATDSKSCTNTTERKKVGKSAVRRKRKNINIRKLIKKPIRQKKSTKSIWKNLPNEWIHEKVEEENDADELIHNDDLLDLDADSVLASPEKIYNAYNIAANRNNLYANNNSTYNNRSSMNSLILSKESRRTKSIKKHVNEVITMQHSIFEGRPNTIFIQYPEYCGVIRNSDNTTQHTQIEFKKLGYSLSFKVTGSTHIYNSIVNSLKNAGFQMISG